MAYLVVNSCSFQNKLKIKKTYYLLMDKFLLVCDNPDGCTHIPYRCVHLPALRQVDASLCFWQSGCGRGGLWIGPLMTMKY